ncbi:MAG: GTP pyrophosphokinase family protein [Enterococcus sp.]
MKEYSIKEIQEILDKETHKEGKFMEIEVFELYMLLEMYYQSALEEVETKLKIIDRELSTRFTNSKKNSIHQIDHRIKRFKSVVHKLNIKKVDFSSQNIREHVRDFAGIRVICSYTDDIYLILDSLTQQSDVTLIEVKDYIKHPKPSGYRSVHAIVEIPVFFLDETKYLKVEIQFRTIAMDFWASLEHGLRYKQNELKDPTLSKQLEQIASEISEIEDRMLTIRKEIEK